MLQQGSQVALRNLRYGLSPPYLDLQHVIQQLSAALRPRGGSAGDLGLQRTPFGAASAAARAPGNMAAEAPAGPRRAD